MKTYTGVKVRIHAFLISPLDEYDLSVSLGKEAGWAPVQDMMW
jgi:hypothetical protein